MVASENVPAGQYVLTADHRIVLTSATWEHYELELAMRGDKSVPRLAYLDRALELMRPSRDHERITSYLGRLIEAYAEHADIELSPYRGPPGFAGIPTGTGLRAANSGQADVGRAGLRAGGAATRTDQHDRSDETIMRAPASAVLAALDRVPAPSL